VLNAVSSVYCTECDKQSILYTLTLCTLYALTVDCTITVLNAVSSVYCTECDKQSILYTLTLCRMYAVTNSETS